MINLDSITNKNNKKLNEKWPYIPNHPSKILIISCSGSGKTNTLLNLINEQHNIDKIYLYAKDLNEPKYEILIKKRKNAGIKYLNHPNAFIACSNTMDDVSENINDHNLSRQRKILTVFDDIRYYDKYKILGYNQRIVYEMHKIKYFTCFYHAVLFLCSKRC